MLSASEGNSYVTLLVIIFLVSFGLATGVYAADVSAEGAQPVCPKSIPAEWLSPSAHPRLLCTPTELDRARETVKQTAWGRSYLEGQRSICAPFIDMDAAKLRSLVPKPGSIFVYGLGMNLDPVHQKRMIWCGWENPFSVKDVDGRVYPNKEWPDDGSGVVDPKTGVRYYFVAQANATILQELEQKVLPALGDVYALDGKHKAAEAASVLLDSIASVYATNRRGPIDYPLDYPDDPKEADHAGRLDRPYYQVARGLINYTNTVDLIASSGEFEKPSSVGGGLSVREHIIRDLLWNGGCYCFDYAVHNYQLHNGQADYLRGAAAVGILLGRRDFCRPLLFGKTGVDALLGNNLDRNGLYYETSPLYAEHSRDLYITIAEMTEAAKNLGWKEVHSAYSNPAMRLFLTNSFNRQEVGGHIPVLGDDGPDIFVNDPMQRTPGKRFVLSDYFIKGQITGAWVRLVRSPDPNDRKQAARLLADTYAGKATVEPPHDRWSIYHIGLDAVKQIENEKPNTDDFETDSVFHGAKGFAILRGGRGGNRYGAQLFFGPLHNHGQFESLTWSFYARGAEWSFDPGYFSSHYRFGWTQHSVAHQAVVVDGESVDPEHGSGHLLSWMSTPDVQWAMARHPGEYAERGVNLYERLIAQVQDPSTGDLGYWLDVSRVSGGKVRDDSFHTQMTDAKLSIPLSAPADGSLYGAVDYGRILQDDYRLKGFGDKGFYWSPDGSGYAFLGKPQRAQMPSGVRVLLTKPGYAESIHPTVVADLAGAPGREIIVAESPETRGAPSVPYILRRDIGSGLSVFAKIVRLVDSPEKDHISSFEEVSVEGAPECRAWCVKWSQGRRDLWLVGDGSGVARVSIPGLPEVRSDARVALISFAADGHVSAIRSTEASEVAVSGGPNIRSERSITGRIERVAPEGSPVVLKVAFDRKESAPISEGLPIITMPETGQPAVWVVKSVHGDEVTLNDVKIAMASTEFQPIPDKPGWYHILTAVSRFYAASGRSNSAYAVGKAVYENGRLVGRISEISEDAHSLRLQSAGKPVVIAHSFHGRILEAAPGDRFNIPLVLNWSAK